jgi:dihydrofolate reductase
MRSLKYYVACTADGFIAHEDGSLDGFLTEGEAVSDYLESLTQFDVVLMGRKTYEFGLKLGVTNPYPHLRQYLFSRTMTHSPDDNVTLVSDNVIELVRALKQEAGRPIYLCGGADLATTLLSAGLIDELILKVNPVLFGAGIPLFTAPTPPVELALTGHKVYDNGVVWLFYRVNNRAAD